MGGVLDTWLTPLKAVRYANQEVLSAIKDDKERGVKIAELNVEAGVKVLLANFTIQEAIRDRGLQVHGCIFDLESGRIRDLGIGNAKVASGGRGPSPDEIIRGKHATLVFRSGGASMAGR